MTKRIIFFLFLLCLSPVFAARAETGALPDAILAPGSKPGHILVIDKSEQVLYLYKHANEKEIKLEKVMACSTGAAKGDKLIRGDRKTPNGFYIFNQKLLPSELSEIYGILAYPMDYPNFWDKAIGRGGDGIWLHGINKPLVDYDSNGCIEVENHNLAPLEDLLTLYNTPVLVYEKLAMADRELLQKEGRDILEFVESWRKAWVSKNMAAYRDKYDRSFINSDARSYSAWMNHKENLFHKYNNISVELKDIKVFRHRDVIAVLFEQNYAGDKVFNSVGLKRLYLKKEDGAYKIVAEEFSERPNVQPDKWLTAEEKKRAVESPPLAVASVLLAKNEASGEGAAQTDSTAVNSQEARALAVAEEEALARVKAKADAEDKAAQAQKEAEEKAAAEADARAEEEAIKMAQAKLKAQREAEALAQAEAEKAAQAEAEALAQAEAEKAARAEAEALAKAEAEKAARAEAEALAQAEAEKAAQAEAEALAKAEAEKEELAALAQAWAKAWAAQDTDLYFSFYGDDYRFKDKGMNLAQFKKYRRPLIERARNIKVALSDVKVSVEDDAGKVVFVQDYRSNEMRDKGYKTLNFSKSGGAWKIIGESWRKKD